MDVLRVDRNKENTKVTAYVSKEKYEAPAAQIREWEEDDLWTSRKRSNLSQTSSTDENKLGATTIKRSRLRESLCKIESGQVSSLRKFWEGVIKEINEKEVFGGRPLKPITSPAPPPKPSNSHESASRQQSKDSQRSSLTTSTAAAAAMQTTEELYAVNDDRLKDEISDPLSNNDDDLTTHGNDEESGDSDSVNTKSIATRSVGVFTSTRTSRSSPIPVSPGKGSKSVEAGRRISRNASALPDFESPPIPLTQNEALLRRRTEIMEAEKAASLRRMERVKEIRELLGKERVEIVELGSRLRELQSRVKAAKASIQKSSKHHSAKPVDENELVDLNLQFLLACQRRQSLLDELSVLSTGSRVLVPPRRGEPLRARFQLSAIRLALKKSEVDPGYVVVTPDMANSLTVDGRRPVKYHLIALLKCVGEGRMYYTHVVTLMRLADLPTLNASAAAYVDLPASIDILPMRPDFAINIEIYCLQTGSDRLNNSPSFIARRLLNTRLSRSIRASARVFYTPIASSTKMRLGIRSNLSSSKSRKQRHQSYSSGPSDLSAAFTLLSSVQIHHTDDLLYGRYPPARDLFSAVTDVQVLSGVEMPLVLHGLPRSTPLTGRVGMCDVLLRLQSLVLKRGFLTIFDESEGMGFWTRCWCKLTADQLEYWRYPEDEESGKRPIGRLDMRCTVRPWAVQAPCQICVRSNSIYIRSLITISSNLVPLLIKDNKNCNTKSILFHASADNRCVEQRHLMCADSVMEMDSWVKEFKRGAQLIRRWMPEHFIRLALYDANLTFTEPVSAKFAARLKRLLSE